MLAQVLQEQFGGPSVGAPGAKIVELEYYRTRNQLAWPFNFYFLLKNVITSPWREMRQARNGVKAIDVLDLIPRSNFPVLRA